MRSICILALIFLSACAAIKPINSTKDFAVGLFTGMRATNDVTHGYGCVNDLTDKMPLIQEDLQNLETLNPSKLLDAIKKLQSTISSIFQDNSECGQSVQEGKIWNAKIVSAFVQPSKIIQGWKNIINNIEYVKQDFRDFEAQCGNSDFLAGYKLGDIVATYVWGVQQSQNSFLVLRDSPLPFTDCQAGASKVKITGINVSSNPVKGTKSVMKVSGSASEHVELKEVKYSAKLGGVPIHSESIADQDILESGDAFNFEYNVLIPSIAPSGQYDLSFNVYNMDGASVACFEIKVNL